MKDSDFKNLNHVVGALKIATRGSAVSDGYKPDITVVDVTNKVQFILESEQKTDRKAFLGDVIKAQKYAEEREASPTLVIVMQPQSNTTVEQIANHLQPYVTWLKQKFKGEWSLSGVAVISDSAYQDSVNAKEQLGSVEFLKRGVSLKL
jgi:hypothetical protein